MSFLHNFKGPQKFRNHNAVISTHINYGKLQLHLQNTHTFRLKQNKPKIKDSKSHFQAQT